MNELTNFIRGFGLARLGAIVGVTFGVAVALGLIIARIGTPSMSVLYADLNYGDAQTVTNYLDQAGAPYELRDNGNSVSVMAPRDRVGQLRIDLAGDGLMIDGGLGGVGYEIFDDSQTLGSTTFQQNINRLRALELSLIHI